MEGVPKSSILAVKNYQEPVRACHIPVRDGRKLWYDARVLMRMK